MKGDDRSAKAKEQIFALIATLSDAGHAGVKDDTPLIGGLSALNSIRLVELCIKLEDLSTSFSFRFDWTSDVAMSRSRSMFRTAGSLVSEFLSQMRKAS